MSSLDEAKLSPIISNILDRPKDSKKNSLAQKRTQAQSTKKYIKIKFYVGAEDLSETL